MMLTKSVSHKLENCWTHDFENLNRSTGDKGSVVGSFVTDDNEIICSRHHIQLLDSYNELLLRQGVTTALVEENSGVDSIGLVAMTNDHVDISQPSFELSAMNETELLTFITTSSSCLGCGLVQGLVLGASSLSRRNERERVGCSGCGGFSSACRCTSCSWMNVHVVDIRVVSRRRRAASSLKFIAKSFLKTCHTRFVLICCVLALLMCVCVGAGSPTGSSAPARGHNLSFKSTGKIFFSSSPSHLHLALPPKHFVFQTFFRGLKYFFRSKQSFRNLFEQTCNFFLVYSLFLTHDECSNFVRFFICYFYFDSLSFQTNCLSRWNEKKKDKEMDSPYFVFDIEFVVINGHRIIGFGFGV